MHQPQAKRGKIVYHRDREVILLPLAEQESLASSVFVTKESWLDP